MAFPNLDKQNIQKLVNMDLQQKNKLKLFLLPTQEGFSPTAGGALGSALALLGNYVTTLYIQSIDIPGGLKIETDDVSKRSKSIVRPDDVTMTFLEDEVGTVWRYLQTWRKSIAYVAPTKGLIGTLFSSNVEYVFADNQESSERIGIIILQSGKKQGYKFPRIMLYGLKFKGFENLQIGYNETGNLIYTVTFSVREVAAPLV
jgi:hypothetical protein